MCNMVSYLLNINLQALNIISPQISLRVWAAIFESCSLFLELVLFPCFRPNPDTRMCVSTLGSF